MSNFRILFEWEDPAGVRGPELAATWARLEILVNGTPLTEIEDLRTKAIRSGRSIPWPNGWRQIGGISGTKIVLGRSPLPFARHSFLAAREGFALPDIRIWPAESRTLLECCPYEHAHAAVRFLNRSDFSLDREAARDETIRLVEAVLDKLSEKQIAGTCLQEEWRLITHSESNEGERTFCECAARLGIDPYALDPQVGTKLEELLVQLPVSVLQDFFDSADPAQFSEQADPLIAFFRSAEVQDFDNVWKHIPRGDRELMATLPVWRQGYEYAHFLRNEMDLNGQRYANIDEILASLKVDSRKVSITSWPTEQMDAVTGLSARQAPVFSLSGQRTESRNLHSAGHLASICSRKRPNTWS
jgi:hypothetical protein